MAEVINSLFGVTPESLMAQREQALQTQAMQYARLDPFQRATAGIYAGANKLGGAFGGMLGAQDPEMMRLTQRQSLLQQAQPTNAKGWSDLGSQLMQRGDIQGAQEAYAKAQALTKAAGEAEKTQSEIEKNKAAAEKDRRIPTPTDARTPEEKNAAAYALTKGKPETPEYKEAFAEKFNELTTKEGAKPTKVGVTTDASQKAVYSDGQTQFVFGNDPVTKALVKIPYSGGVNQLTSKTEVSVDAKGRSAFSERLGGKDADRVDAAITARESAVQQLDIADRIAALSPTALSGQFANTRLGMVNFLDTLGLTSPKDKQVLASSEVLTADSGRLLLAAMNNKLGGGISNQDAQRFEQIFPQLENSPAARQELVEIIRRSANKVIKESTNLETYARDKQGLGGYKPSLNLPGYNVRTPYSELSDAELAARIKRAQAAQR